MSEHTGVSHDGSRHVTDEHINVYTHLAAAVLAVLGLAHLVVSAGVAGKPWHVVAFAIYGAVVFAIEKPNPVPGRFGFHEIWHLFVMAAAAIHYAFMVLYVLPVP